MLSRHSLTLLRACALLAVLVSTALLKHYLSPADSGFCGLRSGCDVVRKSALLWREVPHLVPLVGVGAYVLIFWLSFFPLQRKKLRLVGMLGGVIGLMLLVYQALALRTFCWLCVTVDVLAILSGALCLLMRQPNQKEVIRGWAWAALFAVAINAPSVWSHFKPEAGLPAAITALQKPGRLNVFEFIDFQCPHCRRHHPVLKAELASLASAVHFQRFHYPLPFHSLAKGAARAELCATEQGKGDEMANLLFERPLAKGSWLIHSEALNLNQAAFTQCLESEAVETTLAAHAALYKATGGKGLPLTLVGNQTLTGAPAPSVVHQAFRAALKPQRLTITGGLFAALMAALAAAFVVAGWRRGEPQEPELSEGSSSNG